MGIILAITSNISTAIQLLPCQTIDEAICKMKLTYDNLCKDKQCDYNNTYIDEDERYAQVVKGLEQVEFRIGKLNEILV